MNDPKQDEGGSRRRFLAVAATGGCAIAAAAGGPTLAAVGAPALAESGKGARFVVAKLEDLQVGVPKKVAIVGDQVDAWTRAPKRKLGSVWVHRKSEREVVAFNATCPHLGCGIDVTSDGNGKPSGYECPCHDSSFDLGGNRGAGPSPRGMDPLPVEVSADGSVAVVFKKFRLGVEAREETG